MATLHRTATLTPPPASRVNSPRARGSYAGSAIEMQLRQALARAEALLREKDVQMQAVLVWRQAAADHLAGLTQRQCQIMKLVLSGQPSKNIAADLGISQRTVENHRAAIMKRTGSTCLAALARTALAAAWDDGAAAPPSAELLTTGGPGVAPAGLATDDWRDGSAARRAAAGLNPANRSWPRGNGAEAFRGSPLTNRRQGASVTKFPTPVPRQSK